MGCLLISANAVTSSFLINRQNQASFKLSAVLQCSKTAVKIVNGKNSLYIFLLTLHYCINRILPFTICPPFLNVHKGGQLKAYRTPPPGVIENQTTFLSSLLDTRHLGRRNSKYALVTRPKKATRNGGKLEDIGHLLYGEPFLLKVKDILVMIAVTGDGEDRPSHFLGFTRNPGNFNQAMFLGSWDMKLFTWSDRTKGQAAAQEDRDNQIFPDQLRSFKGLAMRATSFPFPPFIYYETDYNGRNVSSGIEVHTNNLSIVKKLYILISWGLARPGKLQLGHVCGFLGHEVVHLEQSDKGTSRRP